MVASSRKWFVLAALAVILAALGLPSNARAGGWAVIMLDRLPAGVVAGQPYPVGFTVRQHGYTAWEVDEITVAAEHIETGQRVSFTATPDGPDGHYQVELLLPQPGAWEWSISSGLHPESQPMPALEVSEGQPAAGGASGTGAAAPAGAGLGANPAAIALGAGALAALAAGVALLAFGRARQAYRWAGSGLIVLCAGLAFAFFTTANANARQVVPVTAAQVSLEDTGQQLFLAKGCIVCHVNNRAIENSAELSVQIGPNLTAYHNDAEYLSKFLADPSGVKPSTKMPDLNLAQEEVEALVKFINEGGGK